MMKNKQNQEAENALETQSLMIPDDELNTVAGGDSIDDSQCNCGADGYHLEQSCGHGHNCWQLEGNLNGKYLWVCAACICLGTQSSYEITYTLDPPSHYPRVHFENVAPAGSY